MTIPYDMSEADYQAEIADLRAQVERLHADGAVMRGALEKLEYSAGLILFERAGGDKALSASCGADLLSRYREALELLRDTSDSNWVLRPRWLERRDTLIATVKGGTND